MTPFAQKTLGSEEWATPQPLFDRLNREFGFTLDACATVDNCKCYPFFSKHHDALAQKWTGTVWMNPPYGKDLSRWVKKAFESSLEGATVVCLVPARTCTQWWHEYASRGEVRFIKGRIRFVGAKHNAPFPSAIVIFRGVHRA
jgi:phage N-6-adenine-methyltransferase